MSIPYLSDVLFSNAQIKYEVLLCVSQSLKRDENVVKI
jgi:hypothetical protein